MPRLAVPTGRIDYLTVGSGEPVTVFAHGLGGSITATRPLASGVAGTRAFFHFRGHGATRVDARGFEYADLAAELTAVADHLAATRALGVSLGAGALLRLVAGSPARFDRLVFFLPAAIDRPCVGAASDRIAELTAALTSGSLEQVEGLVRDEIPASAHDRVEGSGLCRSPRPSADAGARRLARTGFRRADRRPRPARLGHRAGPGHRL